MLVISSENLQKWDQEPEIKDQVKLTIGAAAKMQTHDLTEEILHLYCPLIIRILQFLDIYVLENEMS